MHRLTEFLGHVFIIIIAQLILATIKLIGAEYTTVYLQEVCRCPSSSHIVCPPFVIDPRPDRFAGLVFLSRDPSSIRREMRCLLTLRSPPRMQIHVQIESVDIPMVGGTCRGASLQIYDGATTDDLKQQLVGVCGSALPVQRGFSSTGSEVTLSYRQGPDAASASKSFNVTFTYFTTRKSGCRETEFRCTGGHFGCVSGQLTCDGVDNCGDASDESSEYNACGKYSPSSNPAVGGSVGVLVFFAVFGLIAGLGAYGAKKRTISSTRANSCLQLPISSGPNNQTTTPSTTIDDVTRTSPEINYAQHPSSFVFDRRHPLDRMPPPPEVGSPLEVIDDEEATVTTYRIIHVTPNPERRQLQLTVVPYNHPALPSEGHLMGNAALRTTSPPPPYESLFPTDGGQA